MTPHWALPDIRSPSKFGSEPLVTTSCVAPPRADVLAEPQPDSALRQVDDGSRGVFVSAGLGVNASSMHVRRQGLAQPLAA